MPVGKIKLQEANAAALAPCAKPWEFYPGGAMSRAENEIAAGRMGDALLKCGGEKAILATHIRGISVDLSGGR